MLIKDVPPQDVEEKFAAMPADVSQVLRRARLAILGAAKLADGVGPLTECLKWGEPSYLTQSPKTGTTLRLGQIGGCPAVMVPCSTTIIQDARDRFGELPELSGKRGVILGGDAQVVDYVITAALTYHLRKKA